MQVLFETFSCPALHIGVHAELAMYASSLTRLTEVHAPAEAKDLLLCLRLHSMTTHSATQVLQPEPCKSCGR